MSAEAPDRRRLVLVTGQSGAGHNTALKALEDEGYEAVDNLPAALLDTLLADGEESGRAPPATPLAVALDVRTREFDAPGLLALTRRLRLRDDLDTRLVFLTGEDDALRRRYGETRRRHPLADNRSVAEAIALERRMMAEIRDEADLVIDTTTMSGRELGRHVAAHLAPGREPRPSIVVCSFSYRRGLPRNADLVFDVRFLDNPHYVEALRPLTGSDPEVAAHIARDPGFEAFMASVMGLFDVLLPGYEREGKHYLDIAVGCTGGRHRSVFVAERLVALLSERERPASLWHRDLVA